MYVIYPADELLRIYENPVRDPSPVLTGDHPESCQVTVIAVNERNDRPVAAGHEGKKKKERRRERGQTRRRRASRNEASRSYEVAKSTRHEQHVRTMQNSRAGAGEDAANPLKDLTQPGLNEPLKQHNSAALKLVQTEGKDSLLQGKLRVPQRRVRSFKMHQYLEPSNQNGKQPREI
ncbi:hypothetical protein WN48_00917 [Eufriesea mexicana]|uniref:Uncharacterized protein n=1 Tax=Eufriesea mexicana TaxID=516756 RepID=A0A310SD12_9HYME|nr:hypothetical protein WN48_00917 [Eufriesea mexicana]